MENERVNSIEEGLLSEEDYQRIDAFVRKVDIADMKLANSFGRSVQKQIVACSASVLESAKGRDIGMVEESLRKLHAIIDYTAHPEKRGFWDIFHRKRRQTTPFQPDEDAETAVQKIENDLQKYLQDLMKDRFVYEQTYDMSLKQHKELMKYLFAGHKKLEQTRDTEVWQVYLQACQRLENRIIDLETTRQISLQLLSQIRLFMAADKELIEKLRANLNQTIPLWRNQQALKKKN